MKKKLLFIGWLLSFFIPQTFANDFEWTPQIQKAYSEITSLRLQNGRKILQDFDKSKNGVIPYLESLADMIEMAVLEDKNKYADFIEQQELRIKLIEVLNESSPYRNFLIAEIYLHSSFIKLKYGHEVKGANEIIKAYRILSKNAIRFPTFLPQQKPLGILHIVIGSVPKKYQWITNLFGIKGNVMQGIQELENVVHNDKIFSIEAELLQYILSTYIVSNLGDKSKELISFIQKYPKNLAITFVGTSLLIKLGKSEAALNLIKKRPVSGEYLSIPFFNYFLGEIYLQKGKYSEASNAYQDFIKTHHGFNFIKDANYKIYLSNTLNNDSKFDFRILANVVKLGETIVEPDKLALKTTQQILKYKNQLSNTEKSLKKVQLATEGGYYQEGLSIVVKMDELSIPYTKDKVERIYREARILHLMGNTETASLSYQKVLVLSSGQPTWSFAPRSCLYLGNIMQNENNINNAIYFYKRALEYEDYEGSNSVEIRATAGLNELQ
jgi:tetratricopeptide (TPR) repeat protein